MSSPAPIEIAGAPAGRGFAGEEPPAHRTTGLLPLFSMYA